MKGLSKYVAFARIAASHALEERSELYARMVFVAVILGVFSSLWKAVGEAGMPIDADRSGIWRRPNGFCSARRPSTSTSKARSGVAT
jgi:hypothetical protein